MTSLAVCPTRRRGGMRFASCVARYSEAWPLTDARRLRPAPRALMGAWARTAPATPAGAGRIAPPVPVTPTAAPPARAVCTAAPPPVAAGAGAEGRRASVIGATPTITRAAGAARVTRRTTFPSEPMPSAAGLAAAATRRAHTSATAARGLPRVSGAWLTLGWARRSAAIIA